jgi:hypothetical protein
MYEYQSQTSLPPIRPRQQRQSGVQVQQLYGSSPVVAALSHHPSTQYTSHKLQHTDSSAHINGNATTVNNNGTTNGYHHHHHHHNSISQIPGQQQTSEQSLRKSPSVDSMHSSSQQQRSINVLDPETAMKTYMSKMTPYERHEIFSYPQIYFVGQNARKRQGVGGGPNNGKTNEIKFYLIKTIRIYSR